MGDGTPFEWMQGRISTRRLKIMFRSDETTIPGVVLTLYGTWMVIVMRSAGIFRRLEIGSWEDFDHYFDTGKNVFDNPKTGTVRFRTCW